MSVEIRKAHHPFALFCLKLFSGGPRTHKLMVPKQAVGTVAVLAAMPKQTQLLLAHFLELNNPAFTLLDGDTDVCNLLSADWLVSVPCSTAGVVSFKIKPHVWRELRSLRPKFLTDHLLSELETYRKRKSALYPWVW